MATMSRESTDKGVTLSDEQLAGIWAAAQCSPGSAGAQPSDPPTEGSDKEATPTTYAVEETPRLWQGHDTNNYADMGGEIGNGGLVVDSLGLNGRISGNGSNSRGATEGDIVFDTQWATPTAGAGPSTQSIPAPFFNREYRHGSQHSPPFFQPPQGEVGNTVTSTQSRHNLLYQ
ncbi:hypothetical protein QFC19_008622 [Naganishia cerealis]|uniref:Uncharacterized protein n=1 Tax=Naganishia cerealis TaxID=610337 RepID=A0ACC2V0J9_9TREE|nr:hypothetical protein QFC19_008622 [Naganishia cerealis]